MKIVRTAFTFLACALVLPQAFATPRIDGLELISSVRYDRTNFDYTFALKITGDEYHYTNTSYSVKNSDPSSQLIKNTVAIGAIDAGDFVRTKDVFVIRHDRSTPIDYSKLSYNFTGSRAFPTNNTAITIGKISFMEEGGRPQHEGIFPIKADAPNANTQVIFSANIFGAVTSATYSLVDLNNIVLSQGILTKPETIDTQSPKYYAVITTPNVPFKIKIVAYPISGTSVTWQSGKTYTPNAVTLDFLPSKAFLVKGETVQAKITVNSISQSGDYIVMLRLPSGFKANYTSSNVSLSPGNSVSIPFDITAPTAAPPFSFLNVVAQLYPYGQPDKVQSTKVQFIIK